MFTTLLLVEDMILCYRKHKQGCKTIVAFINKNCSLVVTTVFCMKTVIDNKTIFVAKY